MPIVYASLRVAAQLHQCACPPKVHPRVIKMGRLVALLQGQVALGDALGEFRHEREAGGAVAVEVRAEGVVGYGELQKGRRRSRGWGGGQNTGRIE